MPHPLPPPAPGFNRRRKEFPSLRRGIYLLSHSLGPMPRGVRQAMESYLDRWQAHAGEDAWAAEWWELSGQVADALARVLGARPGTVSLQPSATAALATVLSCLDLSGPRRRIVTLARDFPSTGYLLLEQRRLGAEIVTLGEVQGPAVSPGEMADALDERTALLACSHASFLTSERLDPVPLVERAHAAGALVLLDVYQSAGVLELDAAGWGVDFLTGGTIKWLCGGPACGYLYVHPDHITRLKPRHTGWIAHRNPFLFAPGPMDYAVNVRRFAQGTPNVPGLHSCLAGLALIHEVGIPAIAAESRRRTQWMVDVALERGWPLSSPTDPDGRGGSVMIHVPRPKAVVSRLAERRIFVDFRPGGGLRISPHFFNTDEEVQQALEALEEVLG